MASLSVFEDKAGADESVKFAHKWIEETAPNLGTRRRSPRATLSRPTRSRRPYATTLAADARLFF
jgi:hypothetical protein